MQNFKGNRVTLSIVLIMVGGAMLIGLFNLWPLLLIAVGAYLMMRQPTEAKEGHYVEPLGTATRSRIELDLSIGDATITALDGGDALIDADVKYMGEMVFDVRGDAEKQITLRQASSPTSWFNDMFKIGIPRELSWDIRLTRELPLGLRVKGGVGITEIDLRDVQLADLRVDGGLGSISAALPSVDNHYRARLSGGAGDIAITVEPGAHMELDISGGVGKITLTLPQEDGIRLEAKAGIGTVKAPEWLEKQRGENLWQTANFDPAGRGITILYDGGVGDLRIG